MIPRYTVSWTNYYDADSLMDAASQALNDLNDAVRCIGADFGAKCVTVVDNKTGEFARYEMSAVTNESVVLVDNNR